MNIIHQDLLAILSPEQLVTDDHFLRTEPFYTQIFLGAEFEARKHPYYILLATIESNFDENGGFPRFILEKSIDGIIIAGKVPATFTDRLKKLKLPIVMVDYHTVQSDHSAVLIDNIGGAIQATEYLIKLGHNNIAFIGGDLEHPSIRDRYNGFKIALEQNDKPFNNDLVVVTEKSTSRESGFQAAKKLHERGLPFSAAFACNDAMAIGAIRFFKENGIRIPEDVSIIGFDNIEEDLSQETPLTTMSVPKIDMGQDALQLLVQILNKKINRHKKILVPVELIIRDSVKEFKNLTV